MKRKLNYIFYHPINSEITTDTLLNILIKVNEKKVEEAIQNDKDFKKLKLKNKIKEVCK